MKRATLLLFAGSLFAQDATELARMGFVLATSNGTCRLNSASKLTSAAVSFAGSRPRALRMAALVARVVFFSLRASGTVAVGFS